MKKARVCVSYGVTDLSNVRSLVLNDMQKRSDTEEEEVANKNEAESSSFSKSKVINSQPYSCCIICIETTSPSSSLVLQN